MASNRSLLKFRNWVRETPSTRWWRHNGSRAAKERALITINRGCPGCNMTSQRIGRRRICLSNRRRQFWKQVCHWWGFKIAETRLENIPTWFILQSHWYQLYCIHYTLISILTGLFSYCLVHLHIVWFQLAGSSQPDGCIIKGLIKPLS